MLTLLIVTTGLAAAGPRRYLVGDLPRRTGRGRAKIDVNLELRWIKEKKGARCYFDGSDVP